MAHINNYMGTLHYPVKAEASVQTLKEKNQMKYIYPNYKHCCLYTQFIYLSWRETVGLRLFGRLGGAIDDIV